MAYNENLADRAREMLVLRHNNVEEKKMFGGMCFMVDDKMCVGVIKDELMIRLDPGRHDEMLEQEGCRPMDFSGKSMKGFVFVDATAIDTDRKLQYWVDLALDYNPLALASKKKKTASKK